MNGLEIEAWFNGLHIIYKCALALLVLPCIFTFVGLLIFIQEPPGDSFWSKSKPSLWEQILGTAGIGFIGSVLLAFIFGVYWLISSVFAYFHAGDWAGTASFILALIIVLGAVIYWFEVRAVQEHQKRNR